MQTNNFVTIHGLSFYRGQRAIFNNIDINVARGKITAIMGPSGTGKTTLLRLIGAQLKPSAGIIDVDGQNLHKLSQNALYTARQKIGMLFQSSALFTNLSVYENIAFPLREHTNLAETQIRDLVLLKLQAVGLRGAHHLMPNELSGGMARRIALARAIALDPQLIMYDEPFAGQDPIAMGVILRLIRSLNDALGLTSILVSHDIKEVTAIADYIYLIADGKIIGQGTPTTIEKEQSPLVKQFIQGLPDGAVPFHYPAPDLVNDFLRVETND